MNFRRSALPLAAAFAAGVSLLVSGCATPPAGQGEGGPGAGSSRLTIKGSDTMVILGQRWAEVYMDQNQGSTIQVTGGGSGTGFAALINGTTDVAMASRPIKDKERENVREKFDADVQEFVVAKDGVTVYVHSGNPLEAISVAELKDVYTGKITNWKDLGGPDKPITLYSRENNSGTYVFFKEHVLDDEDYAASAQNMPGTASVVNSVSKDAGGIGYGGIAYSEGVKALRVSAEKGGEAFEGTQDNILSGDYPLSRDLYLYSIGEPKGLGKAFIDWTLSDEGQQIVEEVEYIPVR